MHNKFRAQRILAEANACGDRLGEAGAHSYAGEAGYLQSTVQTLCDELDVFHGIGVKDTTKMTLGEAEVLVQYDYEPEESAVYDLNSPMCGPGCAANAVITAVLINGLWIDPGGVVPEEILDKWVERILEGEVDKARDDYETYMAERSE